MGVHSYRGISPKLTHGALGIRRPDADVPRSKREKPHGVSLGLGGNRASPKLTHGGPFVSRY